ncbi:hypothetical protein LINPERPRIM_LOCUS22217 [Linum perenne]
MGLLLEVVELCYHLLITCKDLAILSTPYPSLKRSAWGRSDVGLGLQINNSMMIHANTPLSLCWLLQNAHNHHQHNEEQYIRFRYS